LAGCAPASPAHLTRSTASTSSPVPGPHLLAAVRTTGGGWVLTNRALYVTSTGSGPWTRELVPGLSDLVSPATFGTGQVAWSQVSATSFVIAVVVTPRHQVYLSQFHQTKSGLSRTSQEISIPLGGSWSGAAVALSFGTPQAGWLALTVTAGPRAGRSRTVLFETRTGGRAWRLLGAREPFFVTSPPTPFTMVDSETGFAAGPGTLLETSDAGSSWRAVSLPGPPPEVDPPAVVSLVRAPGCLVATEATSTGMNDETSFDLSTAGGPWRMIEPAPAISFPRGPIAASLAVAGCQNWYAGTPSGLWKTADAGSSWQVLAPVPAAASPNTWGLVQLSFPTAADGWGIRQSVSLATGLEATQNGGRSWTALRVP